MSPRISLSLALLALSAVAAEAATISSQSSNLFLPGHVQAEEERISLYADFDAIRADGRVPVYVVNRTGKAVKLNSQDGDIYLKLEYRDADGNWQRAQSHSYSFCGNSYFERELRPDHHVVAFGYQPINGRRETIRYRLYSQDFDAWSNVGDGVVADGDIQNAASDSMSIQTGSFEYVAEVALSDVPIQGSGGWIRDLRDEAIWALASGKFDAEKSRAVLIRIRERSPERAADIDMLLENLEAR